MRKLSILLDDDEEDNIESPEVTPRSPTSTHLNLELRDAKDGASHHGSRFIASVRVKDDRFPSKFPRVRPFDSIFFIIRDTGNIFARIPYNISVFHPPTCDEFSLSLGEITYFRVVGKNTLQIHNEDHKIEILFREDHHFHHLYHYLRYVSMMKGMSEVDEEEGDVNEEKKKTKKESINEYFKKKMRKGMGTNTTIQKTYQAFKPSSGIYHKIEATKWKSKQVVTFLDRCYVFIQSSDQEEHGKVRSLKGAFDDFDLLSKLSKYLSSENLFSLRDKLKQHYQQSKQVKEFLTLIGKTSKKKKKSSLSIEKLTPLVSRLIICTNILEILEIPPTKKFFSKPYYKVSRKMMIQMLSNEKVDPLEEIDRKLIFEEPYLWDHEECSIYLRILLLFGLPMIKQKKTMTTKQQPSKKRKKKKKKKLKKKKKKKKKKELLCDLESLFVSRFEEWAQKKMEKRKARRKQVKKKEEEESEGENEPLIEEEEENDETIIRKLKQVLPDEKIVISPFEYESYLKKYEKDVLGQSLGDLCYHFRSNYMKKQEDLKMLYENSISPLSSLESKSSRLRSGQIWEAQGQLDEIIKKVKEMEKKMTQHLDDPETLEIKSNELHKVQETKKKAKRKLLKLKSKLSSLEKKIKKRRTELDQSIAVYRADYLEYHGPRSFIHETGDLLYDFEYWRFLRSPKRRSGWNKFINKEVYHRAPKNAEYGLSLQVLLYEGEIYIDIIIHESFRLMWRKNSFVTIMSEKEYQEKIIEDEEEVHHETLLDLPLESAIFLNFSKQFDYVFEELGHLVVYYNCFHRFKSIIVNPQQNDKTSTTTTTTSSKKDGLIEKNSLDFVEDVLSNCFKMRDCFPPIFFEYLTQLKESVVLKKKSSDDNDGEVSFSESFYHYNVDHESLRFLPLSGSQRFLDRYEDSVLSHLPLKKITWDAEKKKVYFSDHQQLDQFTSLLMEYDAEKSGKISNENEKETEADFLRCYFYDIYVLMESFDDAFWRNYHISGKMMTESHKYFPVKEGCPFRETMY